MRYVRLNGEAVKSILECDKTQMRFALKKQDILGGTMTAAGFLAGDSKCPDYGGEVIKPPYENGEIIYVRETWAYGCTFETEKRLYYRADGDTDDVYHWNPSIHMPQEVARIHLRVTDICVERLQDISVEDIEREGVWLSGTFFPKDEFARLYNRSLSKKKRELYSWDKNPWVWVVTFERCEKPEV